MSDLIDLATQRCEELAADALTEHLRRTSLAVSVQQSAHRCACCGEDIPEARRQAYPGVVRCIDCQKDVETQEKWRK